MNEERVTERTNVDRGQIVLPFYIVCDVSYSMAGDMDALNKGLEQLWRAIVREPIVDDVARISIITFSDTAKTVMPLGQMSESGVPRLSPEGGTNYGSAFEEVARAIEDDRAALKRQGYKVFRPCAFFLSDGAPLDENWEQAFRQRLTFDRQTGVGMRAHPVFVPFGFREAPESVLSKLAYPPEKSKWYHAHSTGVDAALKEIVKVLMNTVMSSGTSAQNGSPALVLSKPGQNAALSRYDSDYI